MGKLWKQWQTLSFWAPNSLQMVTVAMKLKDVCSLGGKINYDKPSNVLKSRNIPLLTKVHQVKAMIFSVVLYGCESWTIKKADLWRTDAAELWCWRRLWRVPWTARSSQSILKEISPEYSLEGLMLKLKRQTSGHLTQRSNSLEKALMLWKIKGMRRKEWQRMRCLDHWFNGNEFEQALGDGEVQESLVYCSPWDCKE